MSESLLQLEGITKQFPGVMANDSDIEGDSLGRAFGISASNCYA